MLSRGSMWTRNGRDPGRRRGSTRPGTALPGRCRRPRSRGCPATCGRCRGSRAWSPRRPTSWPTPRASRPAQLRKDLSFLGSYGRRGVGYDVQHLSEQIGVVLGLTTQRRVVIVGIGNLGHALASYSVFAERGFAVVGLVDADPAVVGTSVAGLVVQPPDGPGRAGPQRPTRRSASSRRRRRARRRSATPSSTRAWSGSSRSRRARCGCRSTWTCAPWTWPPSCRSSRSTTVVAPGRGLRMTTTAGAPRGDTGCRRAREEVSP